MSLEIRKSPIFGVQFHPESIMSEYGHEIIDNLKIIIRLNHRVLRVPSA